jgi:hypothetical protein
VNVRFVVATFWCLTVAPATAFAPPAGALHLVGRGPDTAGVCGNVVVHANAAIAAALRDDQTVEHSLDRLRTVDFDESSLPEHNGVSDLRRLSGELAETSARGTSEVQRLRGYATRSDEGRRRAELTVFADALASALDRQSQIGAELDRFVTDVAERDLREGAVVSSPAPNPAVVPSQQPRYGRATGSAGWESVNAEARATVTEIGDYVSDVRRDESHAAELSDAAVGGC